MLRDNGFQAFLVGGAVRDLLLGKHPKDFDVGTNATPEQVRALFRRSRIIGRRFIIVHVVYGREVVEVTTFRGHHDSDTPVATKPPTRRSKITALRSDSGMLLRDNVYGTLEEDALRRDFSINALYYNSEERVVYDYTGGFADIQRQTIRMIGDATLRYREDPVRILRALRFAAKLGFRLATATAGPIGTLADSLTSISPARLFDEVVKLLMAGHGVNTYALLQQYNVFAQLFPTVVASMSDQPTAPAMLQQALRNTDRRIAEAKHVTPAFLFAALLWPALQPHYDQLKDEGVPPIPAIQQAARCTINEQRQYTAIPRRFSLPITEIWHWQLLLPRRHGRRADYLMQQRRFRAAYDFFTAARRSWRANGRVGAMVDGLPNLYAGAALRGDQAVVGCGLRRFIRY